MIKSKGNSIFLAAMVASISIYSVSTFAVENNVCTSKPESCKSGTIMIIDVGKDVSYLQTVAKFCDFNKSVMGVPDGVVCVMK